MNVALTHHEMVIVLNALVEYHGYIQDGPSEFLKRDLPDIENLVYKIEAIDDEYRQSVAS